MDTLLERYSKHCKEQEKNLPFSFNVLDEQCGHIVENSHTNVLMKILQYKNQYGYVFLEKFFDYIGLGIKIDYNQDIKFGREKYYKGVGRMDGFIYQPDQFAFIIENKVNGADNQENQLLKYIDAVLNDESVFSQQSKEKERKARIWVCFLTKNGREKPDTDSQEHMLDMGICTQICDKNSDVVEGPRYAAINYLDHILPWLKEEIQPIVLQRDQTLNAGILQYIDFLEGMFGLRQADAELLLGSKQWLNKRIGGVLDLSFERRNSELETINKELDDILNKKLKNTRKSDKSDLRRYAGLLDKLITDINDEPMKAFFDFTRQYFESNGLMKQCVISHIFNYYYIQIRDVSWPRCIHFEWYPLGITKLMSNSPDLKLCLHVENSKYYEAFNDFSSGFEQDNKTSSKSFSKKIEYGLQKSILDLNKEPDEMNKFLKNAYGFINKEMIKCIEDAIASVNKVQKD